MKKITAKIKRRSKKSDIVKKDILTSIDWSVKYKDDYLISIKHEKKTGKGTRPRLVHLPKYFSNVHAAMEGCNSRITTGAKHITSITRKFQSAISTVKKLENSHGRLKNIKTATSSHTAASHTAASHTAASHTAASHLVKNTGQHSKHTVKHKNDNRKIKKKSSHVLKTLVDDYTKTFDDVIKNYMKFRELSNKIPIEKMNSFIEYMNSK